MPEVAWRGTGCVKECGGSPCLTEPTTGNTFSIDATTRTAGFTLPERRHRLVGTGPPRRREGGAGNDFRAKPAASRRARSALGDLRRGAAMGGRPRRRAQTAPTRAPPRVRLAAPRLRPAARAGRRIGKGLGGAQTGGGKISEGGAHPVQSFLLRLPDAAIR